MIVAAVSYIIIRSEVFGHLLKYDYACIFFSLLVKLIHLGMDYWWDKTSSLNI